MTALRDSIKRAARAGVSDHEQLTNRLGAGDAGESYHLSEDQHSLAVDLTTAPPAAGRYLAEYNADTQEFSWSATSEATHFRGVFVSLDELNQVVGAAGDYAYVDLGAGQDIETYVWDPTDNKWTQQKGTSTTETPESIKAKYESNANTNAYTDSEKASLASIPVNALVSASSQTLYVATDGNDSNNGTSTAPFLTIQAAINSLPKYIGAVTIRVRSGTYSISQPIQINFMSGVAINIMSDDSSNKATITNVEGSLLSSAFFYTSSCSAQIQVSSLKLIMNGNSVSGNSAFEVRSCSKIAFSANEVTGFYTGVYASNIVGIGWCQSNIFTNCQLCFWLRDGAIITGWSNVFTDCLTEASIASGIYLPNNSTRNNTGIPQRSTGTQIYAPGYPTEAARAANNPSATNPLATMNDVNKATPVNLVSLWRSDMGVIPTGWQVDNDLLVLFPRYPDVAVYVIPIRYTG